MVEIVLTIFNQLNQNQFLTLKVQNVIEIRSWLRGQLQEFCIDVLTAVHRSHFMDHGFPRSFLRIEILTVELLESEKKAY